MQTTKIATRQSYGEALVELGKKNPQIVVLDADLSSATKTQLFAKQFPERFFNVGIAEQDLMGTAAGLSTFGKIAHLPCLQQVELMTKYAIAFAIRK